MNYKKIKNALIKPLKNPKQLNLALILLFVVAVVVFLGYEIFLFKNRSLRDIFIAFGMSYGVILGVAFLATHVFDQLKKIPSTVVFYGGSATAMFAFIFTSYRSPIGNYITIGALVVFLFVLGLEIYSKYIFFRYKEKLYKKLVFKIVHYTAFILSFLLVFYIFFTDGLEEIPYVNAFDTYQTTLSISETVPEYDVIKGLYGNDDYLKKYSADVKMISESTSVSYFLGKWNKTREDYLGFNIYNIPLNAHFYSPDGVGPFPVVIMVHGNHEMTHDSEVGYEYLGEYLASRGYIVASVDENFLNYSTFESEFMDAGLSNENDARAYVLLSHLKYLQKMSKNKDSLFYQKLDMENIALMGHSRGGEAVSVAAFFNKINYLPNDYRKQLGYDFNIKSVVAIAPTDQQYKPAGRPISLENVNYLLLHGSHDMDVSYLAGSNQYERVTYTEPGYFKSQVWIYGANHGFFNETWHIGDTSPLAGKLHNTGQLMPRKKQEAIASQLIFNFLEASLKNNVSYKAGFENIKAFADLPDNLYLSQFHTSEDEILVDFSEDDYLETGTKEGVYIKSSGLSGWYEGTSKLDGKRSLIFGAYIGWEGHMTSEFILDVSQSNLQIEASDVLFLTLADDSEQTKKIIDINIEILDMNNNKVTLPLSYYGKLQHELEINLSKFYMFEDTNNSESFFQTFQLPINAFKSDTSDFDWSNINKIVLSLPKGEPHKIFLKDLGIRHLD